MSMDYRVGGNLDGITVDAGNLIVHPESLDRPHDSCVLWLRMNEGSGATASDFSGYGNHGTLGAGAAAPTLVAGKYGNALLYDGVDYVSVADAATLQLSRTGCIIFWFKSSGAQANYAGFITKYTTDANTAYLVYRATTNLITLYIRNAIGGFNSISKAFDYTNTDWHLVAARWDGSFLRLSIDLVEATPVAQTVDAQPSTGNPVQIGRYIATMNGIIDELRVYNRALTAAEIMKLYLDEH